VKKVVRFILLETRQLILPRRFKWSCWTSRSDFSSTARCYQILNNNC